MARQRGGGDGQPEEYQEYRAADKAALHTLLSFGTARPVHAPTLPLG